MKPKPIYRIVFAVVVAVGSLLILKGAQNIASKNVTQNAGVCQVEAPQQFSPSNNTFIFFESVTKYLVFSVIK